MRRRKKRLRRLRITRAKVIRQHPFRIAKAIELKHFDSKLQDATLTATNDGTGGSHNPSSTLLVSTMGQGPAQSQRIGRKVTWKSFHISGTVTVAPIIDQTALLRPCNVFIAIVLDTQTRGAAVSSETIFTNVGLILGTATNVMRNMGQVRRFRVLKTVQFLLQTPVSTFDGTNMEMPGTQQKWSMFINFGRNGISSLSSGTGVSGSVVDVTDNSLHVIAYVDNTDLVPKINYAARLRYVG